MPKKFAITAALFATAFYATLLNAQRSYPYEPQERWPADQTISDLKAVSAQNTYNPREMERYDNAMTHLSQFAEKLHQGRFNRSRLDHGIGDLEGILNKNPMVGRARDILNRDLGELRRLRATYRIGY